MTESKHRTSKDTNLPPAYLRHAAKGRAFSYFRDADGKRRRRYFRGPYGCVESRQDYVEFLAEWERANTDGGTPVRDRRRTEEPDTRLSVAEVVAQFLAWADGYYVKHGRPTGEAKNLADALGHVTELFGHTAAEDFGPKRLREVRTAMERATTTGPDGEPTGRGRLGRTTINARVRRIRQCFRWAAAEELIPGSVVHALAALPPLQPGRSIARETERVEPVEWKRVAATLPHLTPTLRGMVLFQWHTGSRPGEVCALRWADVDRSDPKVWIYSPSDHKTKHLGHERLVGIGRRAQEVLSAFDQVPAGELVFSPSRSEAERRLIDRQRRRSGVPPSQQERDQDRADHPRRLLGERWDRRAYTRAIRRAAELAGVASWSPNQLRHAWLCRAEERVGLEKASKAMGHSTLGVTEHYRSRQKRAQTIEVAAVIG